MLKNIIFSAKWKSVFNGDKIEIIVKNTRQQRDKNRVAFFKYDKIAFLNDKIQEIFEGDV